MFMNEIRKKSALPIYGAALIWIIYCLFFPLYKPSHFIWLILGSAAVYFVLSKLIPDNVTYVEEEPVLTGNEQVDALLQTGREAVINLKEMGARLSGTAVSAKISRIIELTEKIFEKLADDPGNYSTVKRFSDYFLPATTKLLEAYENMLAQNVSGENISGTMERIDSILDTTITAYEKQLDALFANQALDIETDITVLQNMMKSQGLSDTDFNL